MTLAKAATDRFRWAIVGTGTIAHRFAQALSLDQGAELVGVVSRSPERAAAFATAHDARIVADCINGFADKVDAVYVATPVHRHADDLDEAALAGLAALVEKPFARTADEAAAMFDVAAQHGTFAMEGMWTRLLPAHQQIRQHVREGRIGSVTGITAGFGIPMAAHLPDGHRLLDPELGGGSLLELGVYPAQLIEEYLGPIDDVVSVINPSASGVDLAAHAILSSGSRTAHLQTSLETLLDSSATIVGEYGSIRVPAFFHAADSFELSTLTGDEHTPFRTTRVDAPAGPEPLLHEARHVRELVRSGRTQSDIVSPAGTVATLHLIDRIRSHARLHPARA